MMTAEFHEGQEVEVAQQYEIYGAWRKAKIIAVGGGIQSRLKPGDCLIEYADEYADGSRWVCHEGNVRAIITQDTPQTPKHKTTNVLEIVQDAVGQDTRNMRDP